MLTNNMPDISVLVKCFCNRMSANKLKYDSILNQPC